MKKILAVTCMLAMAVTSMFAAPKKGPKTYVIDLATATNGASFEVPAKDTYFQYAMDFSEYLLGEKPKKGDIIELHYKGVCSVDMDGLMIGLVDDSASAGYWTNLVSQKDMDRPLGCGAIKAGETFEGVESYTLMMPMKKALKAYIFYDHDSAKRLKWARIGKPATFTWEKTGAKITKTVDPKVAADLSKPKTYEVDVSNVELMIKMEVETENGKITGYGHVLNIGDAVEAAIGRLPVKGDVITVVYKGTSNRDIPCDVITALAESSPSVNWWAELAGKDDNWQVSGGNITAETPFEIRKTFKVTQSAVEACHFRLSYLPGDGVKSSTWKAITK